MIYPCKKKIVPGICVMACEDKKSLYFNNPQGWCTGCRYHKDSEANNQLDNDGKKTPQIS